MAILECVRQSSDTMKGSLYRYNDILGARSYLDHICMSDLVDLALTEGQFIYLIAYLNSMISSKDLILLGTYLDTFQEFSYNYDYLKNNFFFEDTVTRSDTNVLKRSRINLNSSMSFSCMNRLISDTSLDRNKLYFDRYWNAPCLPNITTTDYPKYYAHLKQCGGGRSIIYRACRWYLLYKQ